MNKPKLEDYGFLVNKPKNLYMDDDGMLVKDDVQYIKDLEEYCEELEKEVLNDIIKGLEEKLSKGDCITHYEHKIQELEEQVEHYAKEYERLRDESETYPFNREFYINRINTLNDELLKSDIALYKSCELIEELFEGCPYDIYDRLFEVDRPDCFKTECTICWMKYFKDEVNKNA